MNIYCNAPSRGKNRYLDLAIYLICFVSLFSCEPNLKNEMELSGYISIVGLKKSSRDTVLIIPSGICDNCIDKLKGFLLSDKGSGIKVILVGANNKDIRLHFSQEVLTLPNVYTDTKNKFLETSFSADVAQLFFLKNDSVERRTLLFPEILDQELRQLTDPVYTLEDQISAMTGAKHLIGKIAPKIEAHSINSGKIILSKMLGKVVLVNFSIKNCAACVVALPQLQRIQNAFQSKEFQVLMVSPNTIEELSDYLVKTDSGWVFLAKNPVKIDFPVVANAKEETDLFHVRIFPQMVLIDKEGYVRSISPFVVSPSNESFFFERMTEKINKLL